MEGTTDITDMVFSENNEEREVKAEESVDAKESSGEEEKEKNSINSLSSKVRDARASEDSTSAEAKNGGVLNNLISSILHPNGVGVGDEGERSAAADERERGGDTDDGDEGGGGGLMDNLSSHLPDDAAPDTEEASMLIHSVVRD